MTVWWRSRPCAPTAPDPLPDLREPDFDPGEYSRVQSFRETNIDDRANPRAARDRARLTETGGLEKPDSTHDAHQLPRRTRPCARGRALVSALGRAASPHWCDLGGGPARRRCGPRAGQSGKVHCALLRDEDGDRPRHRAEGRFHKWGRLYCFVGAVYSPTHWNITIFHLARYLLPSVWET